MCVCVCVCVCVGVFLTSNKLFFFNVSTSWWYGIIQCSCHLVIKSTVCLTSSSGAMTARTECSASAQICYPGSGCQPSLVRLCNRDQGEREMTFGGTSCMLHTSCSALLCFLRTDVRERWGYGADMKGS